MVLTRDEKNAFDTYVRGCTGKLAEKRQEAAINPKRKMVTV